MKKIALITGGSGFVGTALARRLATDGWSVRVFDIEPPEEISEGISFIKGDVTDAKAVRKAAEGATHLFHLAALVPVSRASRADFRRVNIEGTRAVLEAAKACNARCIFYSTSSPLYHCRKGEMISEDTPQSPRYDYGVSKAEAEELVRAVRAKGVKVAIVRPRMIIGAGRLGILGILFDWVRTGKPIPLVGGGNNRLQFLSLADLLDFSLLLAAAPDDIFNQDYHLGAKEFQMLHQDIGALARHTGGGSRIVFVPPLVKWLLRPFVALGIVPFTRFHLETIDEDFAFSTEKSERLLGWRAKQSNSEMLIEAYDWYVAHRKKLSSGTTHRKMVRFGALALAPFLARFLPDAKRFAPQPIAVPQGLLSRIFLYTATGGFLKSAGWGRGTIAAFLGLFLVPTLLSLSFPLRALAALALFIGASLLASRAEEALGVHDDPRIVVDEFATIPFAFLGIPAGASLPFLFVGFLLHRFFDALKIPPLRAAETLPRGWGIVSDDVCAALYAHLVLLLFYYFGFR